MASSSDSGAGDAYARGCAGFVVVLVPLVLWFVVHPQQLVGLTVGHTHGEYNQNLGWRGFLGPNAISHLDAWWDCYNLDKLFFSGDPDLGFRRETPGTFCWVRPSRSPQGSGTPGDSSVSRCGRSSHADCCWRRCRRRS